MAKHPDANVIWFNIATTSGEFSVYSFDGVEEVNKPYEFDIELVTRICGIR